MAGEAGFQDFEWEPVKDAATWRKHGVTFLEAVSVFAGRRGSMVFDEEHSKDEDRFLTLGMSSRGRLLIVAHVERGVRIRIISARKATPNERQNYG